MALPPERNVQVGMIEGGIAAASWSPEGELLAIVTGNALLLLFNKVAFCPLHANAICRSHVFRANILPLLATNHEHWSAGPVEGFFKK